MTKKSSGERITLTLLMKPCESQRLFIDNWFEKERKIYNKALERIVEIIKIMETDEEYVSLLEQYKKDNNIKKQIGKQLNKIRQKRYNLTQYGIEPILKEIRKKYYNNSVPADINTKLSERLIDSVNKNIFDHSKMHFKKYGELNSLESKKADEYIVYDRETSTVRISTCLKQNHKSKVWNKDHTEYKKANKKKNVVHEIPVVVKKKDTYAQHLLTFKICYCRIVRKPFNNGYRYYLQLILNPEDKQTRMLPNLPKGDVGIDLGPSTVAVSSNKEVILTKLAPDGDKYNERIAILSRKLERLRRLNNPNNYNEDGTIKTPKEGEKLYWKRTKKYIKVLLQLKDAYRRRTATTQQQHNILAKKVLSLGCKFITEEDKASTWMRKSKKLAERSTRTVTKTDKRTGEIKTYYKFKRKKGLGKSVNNHSPGYFMLTLVKKVKQHGGIFETVDTFKYKASQYHHDIQEYIKPKLNERTKLIHNNLVQRDLYSAFLLMNSKSSELIDQDKCNKEFNNFLNLHNDVVSMLKFRQNILKETFPLCMGIKEF